jgi:hypothetical protein
MDNAHKHTSRAALYAATVAVAVFGFLNLLSA